MYWTRDLLQYIIIASCLRITAVVYHKFCTHGKTSSRVIQRIIIMINQSTQFFLEYKLVHMYYHAFQFGLFTNQLQPITDAENMSSKLWSTINVIHYICKLSDYEHMDWHDRQTEPTYIKYMCCLLRLTPINAAKS